MKYAVNWDNGNGACGTFPERFNNEEDAEAFASDWMRESNREILGLSDAEVDECGGEDCYCAEVIEIEDAPDSEEGDADSAWPYNT